jgi:hypothetical protein
MAEFLVSDANGQHAKRLAVPQDRDFDIDDPVLRDLASQDIGDDHASRCECALLGLNPLHGPARQGLACLDQGVQKLLAIHIGDQHPCTPLCRELTACLDIESVEVVIKERRRAGQRLTQRDVFAELDIDGGGDRAGGIAKARALLVGGPVDETPDRCEEDEIERHREREHQQAQPPGDGQAAHGELTRRPGGARPAGIAADALGADNVSLGSSSPGQASCRRGSR